jgi:hypothetical protein
MEIGAVEWGRDHLYCDRARELGPSECPSPQKKMQLVQRDNYYLHKIFVWRVNL